MGSPEDEEKRLRSAALQNANSVLLARRRAEDALRRKSEALAQSLAMMRATLEATTDGILVTNEQGEVTDFNANFTEMWRLPPAIVAASAHRQVLNFIAQQLADPVRFMATLQEIAFSAPPESFHVLECGDGRVFERHSRIQRVEGRAVGRVWSFRDITERRKAEQALQRARAVAEFANKTKDDFLAALSHELRTPLTPVLAILSSAEEDHVLPPALAADLETVRRNVELETRLIDDLLDLTRLMRGRLELRFERVAIGQLIENAIQTCLPDLQAKQLTLVREIAAPRQTIRADAARITQVLWNLLKNAIKFTPAGGTITVRSHAAATSGKGQVVVAVADTGIGIPASQLGGVFDAFEQGGRKITQQFGGLGLGLAIGQAIVVSHQGTITAASDGPGRGSVFTVTLPCVVGEELKTVIIPAATAPSAAGKKPVVMARPLRILLVEDHEDTAKVIARLVSRSGHEVIHAASVATAFQTADKEMKIARLDLVISDLGLPDGSGLEVMRELSARYGLRGIALSGFGMDSDREQSAAAGFSRHLTKPIDIAELRAVIAELTQGA